MSAVLVANMTAPPTPCTARPTMSISVDAAKPQISEAVAKTTSADRNSARRP